MPAYPGADRGAPVAWTGQTATLSPPLASPPPDTWVEVDPVVAPSVLNGRLDLLLRGRFVAARPIRYVQITCDGEPAHELRFGRPPHDGSIALADGSDRRQYGFACVLSRPVTEQRRHVALEIEIHGEDATAPPTRSPVTLDIAPGDPPRVTVAAGATRTIAHYADALPPIALHVERAVRQSDGRIELLGWALSQQPLVTVQVFAGDRRLGAARLAVVREDVRHAFPGYADAGRSGFVYHADHGGAAADARVLRVEAVAAKGFAHSVTLPLLAGEAASTRQTQAPPPAGAPRAPVSAEDSAPDAGPRRIRLECDEATISARGELQVDGWCVAVSGVARVMVRHDGIDFGDAEYGRPRPDVGRAVKEYPQAARSGFRLRCRPSAPPPPGSVIEVVAEDTAGSRAVATVTLDATDADATPAADAAADTLKFTLDSPVVTDGAVIDPVTGRLSIEGWVLSRAGIEGIDVLVDGTRVGAAYYGLARQDVGAAFAAWPNALRSGFAFQIPSRVLKNGSHEIALHLRTNDAGVHVQAFRITVRKDADGGAQAGLRQRLSRAEADFLRRLVAQLPAQPVPRLLVRCPPGASASASFAAALHRTVASLLAQVAVTPEVTVLVADRDRATAAEVLAALGARAGAVRLRRQDARIGARLRSRDLFGILSPGDWLAADALAELALALDRHQPADFIYCDEARIDPTTQERTPFYKPGWSPDLLAASNYIGRFWLATGRLLRAGGLDAAELATAGDYDLVLRLTEAARHVAHLPRLLAHREAAALDTDAAERAALEAMRVRRGQTGSTVPGRVAGTWRFLPAARARGRVSIIIPTCAAHGHIRTCLSTLREKTYYRDFETVVIDNIPAEQTEWKEWLAATADRVVEIAEPFNWSRFNNRAVAHAAGEWLLFLNDDVEVIEGDWLDRLLDAASEPGVGTVGARLLYPDGKLQHGGMFLANMGQARHAFRFLDREEDGYFGLAVTPRDVSSVTGACLLVSRATFDAIGGFDEAHDVINNDLDFNLRIAESGRRVVYEPDATLVHHELASRAGMQDRFDTSAFEARWAARFLEGDPYFNPNLLTDEDGMTPSDEPLLAVFTAGPVIPRSEVRRILAIKVDHIGDFITALPALRRLRRHFPDARITVLASGAARAFRALEPAIDEIIEFNFFHAKSALGRRDITADDIAVLSERLRPYAFDIAVDLRKHLDTRKLLRASGARVLAGYDHMGQFPWLDVALEWEGDRNLQAKRYHITDNLVHLVDAVAAATEPPHAPVRDDVLAAIDLGSVLTPALRRLFRRPVVMVHAGAGNDLKQWPIAYFATLIRLLVDREDVNVLLIGGPDEAEIAAELQAAADRPGRIAAVVGAVPLSQLPALLACGALYIGNDSGPKHIAAAVGIPTLGIHSGTVDAVEWAPAAPDALALHRATSCSPCYIAAADLCPRQLACLTLIQPIDVYRHCVRLLAVSAAERRAGLAPLADEAAAEITAVA